MGYYK